MTRVSSSDEGLSAIERDYHIRRQRKRPIMAVKSGRQQKTRRQAGFSETIGAQSNGNTGVCPVSTVSALRQEGSKFFGGPLLPSGTIFLLPQRTRMTATAIMFTDSGFAIAADGNQLWGHKPTRNAAIRVAETYCAQKIFGVEAESVALAYIVRGDVANADKTFDAALELKRSVAV